MNNNDDGSELIGFGRAGRVMRFGNIAVKTANSWTAPEDASMTTIIGWEQMIKMNMESLKHEVRRFLSLAIDTTFPLPAFSLLSSRFTLYTAMKQVALAPSAFLFFQPHDPFLHNSPCLLMMASQRTVGVSESSLSVALEAIWLPRNLSVLSRGRRR